MKNILSKGYLSNFIDSFQNCPLKLVSLQLHLLMHTPSLQLILIVEYN